MDKGDEISGIDITIPMLLFHSISGVVTRSGGPVSDASVRIEGGSEQGSRDGQIKPDGSYQFEMLIPGTYTIRVFAPAFESEDHRPQITRKITVQLADSDVVDANFELSARAPSE